MGSPTPVALPVPERPQYNRDVRPILADACFRCHGFDKNTREGDRRLDTREGATAENGGFRAIVPGDLKASELHLRIHSKDQDEVMPPPKAHRQLTAREKEILDRWIVQGAEYEDHWAYLKPTRPAVPAVEEAGFTRNAIDRFALARQRELGLQHAGEADRATLIRRLSLDLLGLPPKTKEIDAFVADRSRDAYEKLVERLLASAHFGERMAVWWLDMVRYADTIGYHSDNPRNVWLFRDYVIRAFNENKPFDRFTIEQIAGDLLPDASIETKVASAYNRLTMTTEEGGAQAKEYEHKSVVDRVKSIGTTWLGQTFMCAECHDHKYDPVTQKDFYSMGAFFADIKEAAIGKREDGMIVGTEDQRAELKRFDEKLAGLKAKLDTVTPELEREQEAWEKAIGDSGGDVAWTALVPEKAHGEKASQLVVRPDHTIKVEASGNPAADTYKITVTTRQAGITGFKLEVLPSGSLPANGPGRAPNGNFVLSDFRVDVDNKPLKFSVATATYEQKGYPAAEAIDGKTGRDNGWAVMGNTGKEAAAYFELAEPLAGGAERTLVFTLVQTYGDNHTIGKFRLSATSAPKPIRAPNLAVPPDISRLVKIPRAQRTADQQAKIGAHYREKIAPSLEPVRKQIAALQKERTAFEKTLSRCLVSESMPNPRTVRILPRGNWMDDTGDVMVPETPHFLPGPKPEDGKRLSRVDLANWLVSKENPLTARVFVNRLWKQFYGIGLSKTLEDLGTQGEIPVNQALLDWLACEFMESGWDVKHMVRLMVTSGAYRQSSAAPRELLARDPDNRELCRGGRWRLDAEFVRDNALTISGLIVHRLGGPSVKPYQPAGYWENLNFPTREWENDKGPDQWRRGLYTWWQRSYLQPSLLAFDAPTREECAADRLRSNIPQQALALLNDPTYVEAARAFAVRILTEGGATAETRLKWAWREATGRSPKNEELALLQALLAKHLGIYTQDAKAAAEALKVGYAEVPQDLPPAELAAYASVARVLLNLHETITRL